MAIPSIKIITALRKTATELENGNRYEWGHMGSCNCGNLAQTITKFSRAEIQKYALEKRGDWTNQLVDYCPTSGYPMDMIIEKMLDFGFSKVDLRNLEWLSDDKILAKIKVGFLNRNLKSDTITYLKTWAILLEDQLIETIELPNLNFADENVFVAI
jgi:hypothetical protein